MALTEMSRLSEKLLGMSDDWAPFGLSDDAMTQYRVLVDGVPQRLREPIVAWFKRVLMDDTGYISAIGTNVHNLDCRRRVKHFRGRAQGANAPETGRDPDISS